MHGWPAHSIHTYVCTVDDITLLSCSSSSLSNMAMRKHTDTVKPPPMTFLTFLYSTQQSLVHQTSAVYIDCEGQSSKALIRPWMYVIFCMQP